jgi:hypothetical protein
MPDYISLDKRFRKLFQDGKLMHIHVRKWGMSHQLTEEDLGLDQLTEEEKAEKKVADFMLLGKKWLFTSDVRLAFGRIEAAARKYLADNSYDFPLAMAHFVPQKALVKVLTTLAKYKEEYDKATAEFLKNYDQHKQEMFEKYPDHRAILEPHYPTLEQIRPKFSFNVTMFEVAFPRAMKNVTFEDIVAQNIAVEEAKKKYEVQLDQQYQSSIKQMEAFVKEAGLALRAEVIKTFEVIAEKIQGKQVITGTNLNTIRNVIESFDGLDFLDDAKVKENLQTVKRLVNSGADFRDDEKALARLTTAVNTTLETARNMSDIDQITGGYIRRLDVGDEL